MVSNLYIENTILVHLNTIKLLAPNFEQIVVRSLKESKDGGTHIEVGTRYCIKMTRCIVAKLEIKFRRSIFE